VATQEHDPALLTLYVTVLVQFEVARKMEDHWIPVMGRRAAVVGAVAVRQSRAVRHAAGIGGGAGTVAGGARPESATGTAPGPAAATVRRREAGLS